MAHEPAVLARYEELLQESLRRMWIGQSTTAQVTDQSLSWHTCIAETVNPYPYEHQYRGKWKGNRKDGYSESVSDPLL